MPLSAKQKRLEQKIKEEKRRSELYGRSAKGLFQTSLAAKKKASRFAEFEDSATRSEGTKSAPQLPQHRQSQPWKLGFNNRTVNYDVQVPAASGWTRADLQETRRGAGNNTLEPEDWRPSLHGPPAQWPTLTHITHANAEANLANANKGLLAFLHEATAGRPDWIPSSTGAKPKDPLRSNRPRAGLGIPYEKLSRTSPGRSRLALSTSDLGKTQKPPTVQRPPNVTEDESFVQQPPTSPVGREYGPSGSERISPYRFPLYTGPELDEFGRTMSTVSVRKPKKTKGGFDMWAGGSLSYTGYHLSGPGHVTEPMELGPYADATVANAWKRAKHRRSEAPQPFDEERLNEDMRKIKELARPSSSYHAVATEQQEIVAGCRRPRTVLKTKMLKCGTTVNVTTRPKMEEVRAAVSGASNDAQRRRGLRREAIVDFVTHTKFKSTNFRAVLAAAKERIQHDKPHGVPDASARRRRNASRNSDASLSQFPAPRGVGSGYDGDVAWVTRAQFIRVLRNAGFDSRTDLRCLNRLFSSYDVHASDAIDMVWFTAVMDRYQNLTADAGVKGRGSAASSSASGGASAKPLTTTNTHPSELPAASTAFAAAASFRTTPRPQSGAMAVSVGKTAFLPKTSPSRAVLQRSKAGNDVTFRSLSPGRQQRGAAAANTAMPVKAGKARTAATTRRQRRRGDAAATTTAATTRGPWTPITPRVAGDPRPIRRNSIRRAETHVETFDLAMFYED